MKLTKEQEIFIFGTFCECDVATVDVRRKLLLKYGISGRTKYPCSARDFARVLESSTKTELGTVPV